MTNENLMNQMEMLQYIKFEHKDKDKNSSVFTPYDVTLRDSKSTILVLPNIVLFI